MGETKIWGGGGGGGGGRQESTEKNYSRWGPEQIFGWWKTLPTCVNELEKFK